MMHLNSHTIVINYLDFNIIYLLGIKLRFTYLFTVQSLREYYNSNTIRSRMGRALVFNAKARILDGREAIYTGEGPIVASYSSRGPNVNNTLMQDADILKPNILAQDPQSGLLGVQATKEIHLL